MKKLTKIRLINWHYFSNETINIKGNTLLTGQNASGKSTILDAVTYIITGGDQCFNLAANEKGKRDLRSYVKCKLGSVTQEYLRDYDLSSHICLEFESEKTKEKFCLGCVIDVIGSVTPPKTIFYIINDEMKESYFINENNSIKSILDFKKANITPLIYTTKKEIKNAYKSKLGGVNDNYFGLLPKALAFKPISNVKDYIYNQMLDKKEIDVVNVKDSIKNYTELERILKTTQEKLEILSELKDKYYTIKSQKEEVNFYSYFSKDFERKANLEKINNLEAKINTAIVEKENAQEEIKNLNIAIQEKMVESKRLYSTLMNQDSFKNEEMYDIEINKKRTDLDFLKEKASSFKHIEGDYKDRVKVIEELSKDLARPLSKLSFSSNNEGEYVRFVAQCNSIQSYLDEAKNELISKNASINFKINEIQNKIKDTNTLLNNIDKYQMAFPRELLEFRAHLEKHLLEEYNARIKVNILAEVLEISDPSWQDTIENYLGAQRFTLIVEPYYYDACLDCYNALKNNKVYGINLLNTKKISIFDKYEEGSLASIIQTDNEDARHYINYLCGSLIMVDDVHELDNYNQSITKSGMLYKGYVTRYLNPNIPKPFIGHGVKDIQQNKYQATLATLNTEFASLQYAVKNNENILSILTDININEFKEAAKANKDVSKIEEEINSLLNRKKQIVKGDNTDLEKEYADVEGETKILSLKKDQLQQTLGSAIHAIEDYNKQIDLIKENNNTIDEELKTIEDANPLFYKRSQELYETNGKINYEEYSNKLIDLLDSIKALERTLTTAQIKYISTYNRPFDIGYDKMDAYLDEYNKLYSDDLLNYANKMREARERAEKLFKEDFLSKLRNYILEAQDEISKINEQLDKIVFGNDKYQFIFPKSQEFGAIYDLIMSDLDENNLSLFNPEFEKKYKQELDELFTNLSLDGESSNINFDKYTDYRTYMDYDIKILSGDNEFLFSNILKEKSGGETQIPFYVSILASFVRMFDRAEKSGLDDSVGLIMFDEVFDKMDASRINSMMEFISKLNVQIIFACPPQKMEIMSQLCSTTIAVYRNDKEAATFIISDK